MAGLMPMQMSGKASGQMGGGGGMMADDQTETAGQGDDGDEAATPEEQALYDKFVGKCMELVYSKMYDRVIEMLKGGDPVESLAQTASMVIFRVIELAAKSGQPVSSDILLHAGQEVFEDIANLATMAGIYDFQGDQKSVEAAFYRTIDYVRLNMEKAGLIDQNRMKQTLGALQQMDADGQLSSGLKKLQSRSGGAAAEAGPMPAGEEE